MIRRFTHPRLSLAAVRFGSLRAAASAALVLTGASILWACSDDGTSPSRVAEVVVTPSSVILEGAGASQQFMAQARDANGDPVAGVTITWASTNPAVVIVNLAGRATAVGIGTAQVQATVDGVVGSAEVDVSPNTLDCDLTVELAPGESLVQEAVGSNGCNLFLPSGDSGDRYRVTLAWPEDDQNVTTLASATVQVQGVGGVTPGLPSPAASPMARRDPITLPESFRDALRVEEATAAAHIAIRERENALFRAIGPSLRLAASSGMSGGGPAGSTEGGAGTVAQPVDSPSRWVYDENTGVNSGGQCVAGDGRVALLLDENEHLAIYQDSIQRAGDPADLGVVRQMLDYYAAHGKEIVDLYFGGTSDINGDGKIRVIITPEVGENIAAFVWAGDLVEKSFCANSNEMELIWLNLTMIDRVLDDNFQVLTTMIHEAKHVSSLYKGIRRLSQGTGLSQNHPTWMEEGTAEIAAEMAGRLSWARAGGPAVGSRITKSSFPAEPPRFNADNYGVVLRLARTASYLSHRPNGMLNTSVGATVYGSGWHFHRFLGDVYFGAALPLGDADFFLAQNDSTVQPGIEGLEQLTGKAFRSLFLEFAEVATGHAAGLEDVLDLDFSTYDFLATEIFCQPNPLGSYPWPVTVTGTPGDCDGGQESAENSKSFETATYSGSLAPAGMRIHDFISNGSGDGALISASVSPAVPARWVVVRVQ